jgi:hypothetical protein
MSTLTTQVLHRRKLGLGSLCEWKRQAETMMWFRTVSAGDVVESTPIHACSDTGAGDLHSGFPNDARGELEPQPRGNTCGSE